MRESAIEKLACAFAVLHGWWTCKFVSPGLRGVPDRIFIRMGRVIFIEFKKPKEEPTVQQLRRHQEIREAGVQVYWVDNLEVAYDILR